jgi:dual specificity MAP kinase phosphatase
MHPCESKRVTAKAHEEGKDKINHPLPCETAGDEGAEPPTPPQRSPAETDAGEDEMDAVPKCLLMNALHILDIFDLPGMGSRIVKSPRFRPARLPNQINLRNLNIQQIKYTTISDVVLYAKAGVVDGVLRVAEM